MTRNSTKKKKNVAYLGDIPGLTELVTLNKMREELVKMIPNYFF